MPLFTYLKPETTFLLKADTREGVLKEMAGSYNALKRGRLAPAEAIA